MLPLSLLMARQAYSLDRDKPLGRQSAGAGLLEAYLRYGGNQRHELVVPQTADGEWFHQQALAYNPSAQTVLHSLGSWGDAGVASGAMLLPGPGLDEWAWKRMPWGDGAFSLVGLVHTLCSRPVQWGLGQFSTAPVRPWDALICTSRAAKSVVEGFLDRQEAWLRERLGAQQFERPQLPVIPLAVHPEAWEPKEGRQQARREARRQLGLRDEARIVLIAGRLDLLTKFHPEPLLRVLAELHNAGQPELELLVYGEAPNPAMAALWRAGAQELAPHLPIHWIPGSASELAGPVRWAADVFVSLADNPQETFGITPLEAMAAGLPCVVSDWDGYRDTVIQPGETETATGFRIRTVMVEGLGQPEAEALLCEAMPYDQAVGQIAQGIAVDTRELAQKLEHLLNNDELRRAFGLAGMERVQRLYSWRVVIDQWKALVSELNARRESEHNNRIQAQLPPWLPNTSTGFGSFASAVLPENWMPDMPPDKAQEQDRWEGCLQRWDSALLTTDSPRRRGWWLKQGLAEV